MKSWNRVTVNELAPAETTVFESTLYGRTLVGSILIDGTNLTKNATVKVYTKSEYCGAETEVEIYTKRTTVTLATCAIIAPFEVDNYLKVTIESAGSGAGSVSIDGLVTYGGAASNDYPEGICISVDGTDDTEYPLGNRANPVANLTKAVAIWSAASASSSSHGRYKILRGQHSMTGFNAQYSEFEGAAVKGLDTYGCSIDFNDGAFEGCRFKNLHVTGGNTGSIQLENCEIEDVDNDGALFAKDCSIEGTGNVFDRHTQLINCTFRNGCVIELTDPGEDSCEINIKGSGSLQLKGLTANHVIYLDFNGNVTIDATSTGATIYLSGSGTLTNNGTNMNIYGGLEKNITKLLKNKQLYVLSGSDWYLVTYDDDSTTEIARCKIEKYGTGAIANLVGSTYPAIRNKSSV